MLVHNKLVKKAQINSDAFVRGVKMAFLSVNNMLAESAYEDMEELVVPELYKKIRSRKEILSPNTEDFYILDETDVVSLSLGGLNIYRNKFTNLQ